MGVDTEWKDSMQGLARWSANQASSAEAEAQSDVWPREGQLHVVNFNQVHGQRAQDFPRAERREEPILPTFERRDALADTGVLF